MDNDSRVERRKKETRERILKTCEQIFVHEKNYEKVTIREIAARADVSIGALYLYFKTKEDIAVTLLEEFSTRQKNNLVSLHSKKGSGTEKLISLFDYLETLAKDPHTILYSHLSIIAAQKSEVVNKVIRNSISNNYSSIISDIADIFRTGKDDGTIIVDVDPQLLAVTIIDIFFSLLKGIMFQDFIFQADNPFFQYYNPETIFSVFRDIISRGLFISPVQKSEC